MSSDAVASSPVTPVAARGGTKKQIFAWALWDWGTSAFSVIVTTFVFARYIVSGYFVDPQVADAYKAAGGSIRRRACTRCV